MRRAVEFAEVTVSAFAVEAMPERSARHQDFGFEGAVVGLYGVAAAFVDPFDFRAYGDFDVFRIESEAFDDDAHRGWFRGVRFINVSAKGHRREEERQTESDSQDAVMVTSETEKLRRFRALRKALRRVKPGGGAEAPAPQKLTVGDDGFR